MWLFWFVMSVCWFFFGFGVRTVLSSGKCDDCRAEMLRNRLKECEGCKLRFWRK